jgi:hypothetical protein
VCNHALSGCVSELSVLARTSRPTTDTRLLFLLCLQMPIEVSNNVSEQGVHERFSPSEKFFNNKSDIKIWSRKDFVNMKVSNFIWIPALKVSLSRFNKRVIDFSFAPP